MKNQLILTAFRIEKKKPTISREVWHAWSKNSTNISCNMAFLSSDGTCKGGAIIRNQVGNLKMALVCMIPRSSPLEEMIWFCNQFLNTTEMLGIFVDCIQSSHPCMDSLQADSQITSPRDEYLKKRLHARAPLVHFLRVCPRLNNSAMALVCTTSLGVHHHLRELPYAVVRAIKEDAFDVPSFCAEGCFRHVEAPIRCSQDDINLTNRCRYGFIQFLDDSLLHLIGINIDTG